jgi:hypothetical protein
MSWLSLAPGILKILFRVFVHVMAARADALERQQKWEASQDELMKAFDSALLELRKEAAQAKQPISEIQDKMDSSNPPGGGVHGRSD